MNYFKLLTIAAYLHDIWKLAIRGWNFREQKNYEVAHSQFVNDFLEDFWKEWSDIWTIASHHHGKDIDAVLNSQNVDEDIKFATWCVYMADNISALERIEANQKEDFSHIKYPLWNIFDVLRFGEKIETNKEEWRKPVKLTKFDAKGVSWWQTKEYDDLYDEFKTQLEKLIKSDLELKNFNKFISQLDALLQNYLTLVPSDTYNTQIADISLYDHSKLVVAFAIFLYEAFKDFDKQSLFKKSTNEIFNLLKENNKKVFLIWGDFPGIQKYIFAWIKKSKFLTKRLRARSFIVQLLSEVAIEYILDKFNLPRANVLINAGWKFVILVWVENDSKKGLVKQVNQEVNTFLLEQYPGLRFTIFGKGYDLEDIAKTSFEETNNFRQVLTDLFDKLSEQKFKLYDTVLLKQLFQNHNVSWKVLCKYCWMKYFENNSGFAETSEDMCENCKKEIWLWEKLVKEINWIFVNYKDWNFIFDLWLVKNWDNFQLAEEWQLWIKINNWELDFDKNYEKIIWKSVNLYVPKDEEKNKVLSFEKILEKYSKKDWYLVMIKWDVDNMSLILKHWFRQNYSISRLLTFSRFLELFFGKVLHNFLEKDFNQVYTIFSGWDDFVFVMPFVDKDDNLISVDFVKQLYWEFSKFVNDNPYIHFSLSLNLFKKDTPIKIVYELWEKYLKQAKGFAKEKMKDILDHDEEQAGYELKKYVISWVDDKYFVLFDWNENFEEKVSLKHIEDLKEFNLLNLENKSSLRYKVYQTLKQLRGLVENKEWVDYVNLGSKLFYLLVRNGFDKKELKNLEDFIWKLENVDDYDLNVKYWKELFKLALQIYKDR